MSSFLDAKAFPFEKLHARNLVRTLADLYWREADTRRVLDEAGIPLRSVTLGVSSEHLWHDIMDLTARRAQLRQLFDVILADENVRAAWPRIEELLGDNPPVDPGASAAMPFPGSTFRLCLSNAKLATNSHSCMFHSLRRH